MANSRYSYPIAQLANEPADAVASMSHPDAYIYSIPRLHTISDQFQGNMVIYTLDQVSHILFSKIELMRMQRLIRPQSVSTVDVLQSHVQRSQAPSGSSVWLCNHPMHH